VNDLKLRGILEKDTSVRAQMNELGEEIQKQLSTQRMEVESVQSQIRNLDQQIDMVKATASTPSVSNQSITSSARGAPIYQHCALENFSLKERVLQEFQSWTRTTTMTTLMMFTMASSMIDRIIDHSI
jgi:phage shock protein A